MEDKINEDLKKELKLRLAHLLSNGCFSAITMKMGFNILKDFSDDKLSIAVVYFFFSMVFAISFDVELEKIKDIKLLENKYVE